MQEVKSQAIGPYYGYQCDEVSDCSNWEQLGLVLRYTVGRKPVERLLEFIPCECITGEALCEKIIESLTNAGLDIQFCRSQTMDGAGNMSGKQAGCAARFTKQCPRAVYHYCSSHDLNLALCKSCQVKEIHIMLDTLKQLGIFFKYSPKRSRRLEQAIEEVNESRPAPNRIKKNKFGMFCETRWVEKHTTLHDFDAMYEPLLVCLDAIGSLESGWDSKAVGEAYGLLKRITDSTFIACFQTVLHFFGYIRGLSSKLQGSTLDIVQGFEMVTHVQTLLTSFRTDDIELDNVYTRMSKMAEVANLAALEPPRRCGRQTQRSNVPAETPQEYFKRAVVIPFLDSLLQQLNMRFGQLSRQAIQALNLIPSHTTIIDQPTIDAIIDYYRDDLPHSDTFAQELKLWLHMWSSVGEKPNSLQDTLSHSKACPAIFPNITKLTLHTQGY